MISLAEVIHAALGLVKSSPIQALMQWGGRSHVLFIILHGVQEVYFILLVWTSLTMPNQMPSCLGISGPIVLLRACLTGRLGCVRGGWVNGPSSGHLCSLCSLPDHAHYKIVRVKYVFFRLHLNACNWRSHGVLSFVRHRLAPADHPISLVCFVNRRYMP